MPFKGVLYDIKFPRVSTNNKIALTTAGVLAFVLILGYLRHGNDSELYKYLLSFCLSLFPILRGYAFFSIEEHSKSEIGQIEIGAEALLFNDVSIKWTSIEEASVIATDYKGKFEWKGSGSFSNNLSSGLKNVIFIKTDTSDIISGNFLLETSEDLRKIKELLWRIVETNRLPLRVATRIVNPENYDEHQKLKKYCS